MKAEQTMDAQCRKEWSKKHGHDTYVSEYDKGELKLEGQKGVNKGRHQLEGSVRLVGSALTNVPITGTVLSTIKV